MSKMSKAVKAERAKKELHLENAVENFMGGTSYKLDPLETLKMISASSIFGEPSYYRDSETSESYSSRITRKFEPYFIDAFMKDFYSGVSKKSTDKIFTEAIDKALDFDFGKTIEFAAELRNNYFMRLNPQVIMVRAAIHPKRAEFTSKNPGKFAEIEKKVMSRADEPLTQLTYYMHLNGDKNKLPTILKKSIAEKLSSLKKYDVNKYKNSEIGMINAVRISHAHSEVLDELMKTGSVEVETGDKTWEQKRSAGACWEDILMEDTFGHMALLRNLRNIFTEIDDIELCKKTMDKLKKGVKNGKQFPYRYYNAYKMIENSSVNHKSIILDALEECIDISIDNLPKLKGKTMCLSDNSGSAWGGFTSEYGSTVVAEIDNLSSVITGMCSDEAEVGKFGDKLIKFPISKRNGALSQAKALTEKRYSDVGGNTEGGIWIFFRDAIKNKTKYDNIFIYSDMQAGTGGLYGTVEHKSEYRNEFSVNGGYINVYALINKYRKEVNPKVNVYTVQTAGYDNNLIPVNNYRNTILYGWTGKESLYADKMNAFWDEVDNSKNKNRPLKQ